MAGGLMQLVAYGTQDIYLTGNTVIQQTETPATPETPAIPSFNIPLSFWFNQNSNLAIPLVSIPYASQNINLGITDNESPCEHDYDNILYLTEELIEIDKYEECIISFEYIQNNENIATCSQCKKIVKYNVMQQWFNENASCPHCRGEYPEVNFLCGKANTKSLEHLHKKHNLEEQDNESPCNKKAKLG
jgi:hypothetical protein